MDSLLFVGEPIEAVVSDRADLSTLIGRDAALPLGCASFIALCSKSEESIPFTLLRRLSKGDALFF